MKLQREKIGIVSFSKSSKISCESIKLYQIKLSSMNLIVVEEEEEYLPEN